MTDRRHTPDPHHVLRFFVGLYTLAISAVIAFEPTSLMSWIFGDAGMLGRVVVIALALMGTIGIADVVLNDTLGDDWAFRCAAKFRAAGYWLQGALNLGLVLVMMRSGYLSWVATFFLVQAAACAWVGGADCWVRVLRPSMHGYARVAGERRDRSRE